jgi:hypothetical protein
MITDAILRLLGTILQKIVDLLPDAPIIATGNGASSGFACCATFMIAGITTILNTGGAGGTALIPGGFSGLANSTPLGVLIDLQWLGFIVGCLMAVITAFFIIKILLLFWAQVKW